MTAFNARDSEAWAATLNYPHLRIASGELKVWQTEEEFAASFGRQNRDIIPAIFGKHSPIWMSGTLVAIGLNGPRIFAGASGFMSNVSS